MNLAPNFSESREPLRDVDAAARAIVKFQMPNGAIPWFDDGPWDPWNHSECVMALAVMGESDAVRAGFDYLEETQLPDGSWLGEYGNALPMQDRVKIARERAPALRDTNFSAYPAVAVWHNFRLTRDLTAARRRWPMVRKAIEFVLGLQHDEGDIAWCAEAAHTSADDSLLTGNASIYASLGCALRLAGVLDQPQDRWHAARLRLRDAIRQRPDRFDRNGTDRSGFAMNWYYPVLSGALDRDAAVERLKTASADFIKPGLGCLCVRGEPWVTVAESAELAIALTRLGARRDAEQLIGWQFRRRDADGAFWMGWQYDERIVWPQEKPTWTQAAVILALDAVYGCSAAADIFLAD